MSHNPDQLSQLLLETDGLLLLLHSHRDETPVDAIKLLRHKLQLILTLTEGLDEIDEENLPSPSCKECNLQHMQSDEISTQKIASDNEDPTQNDVDNYIEETIEEASPSIDTTVKNNIEAGINKEPDTLEQDYPIYTNDSEVVEYNPNYEFVEMESNSTVITDDTKEPVFMDQFDEPIETESVRCENDSRSNPTTSVMALTDQIDPSRENTSEPEPIPYHRTYVINDTPIDKGVSSNIIHTEPIPTRRPVSSVFNLNDKFRFRRELFGNSDAQYVECLDLLSAMSNLDEAKDYLYEDLKWDQSNEDVKAFVELLSNYYK